MERYLRQKSVQATVLEASPKRFTNIIVTRDPEFAAPGIVAAPSLFAAMEVAEGDALRRGAAAIVIGGGADIYAETINGDTPRNNARSRSAGRRHDVSGDRSGEMAGDLTAAV
jgi:hypothetical protein